MAAGPLSAPRATELALGLGAGLAALHASGILHRDIKPSNVGFTRSAVPKLLDFGIASLVDRADVGEIAGTPAYMSPELLAGAAPATADDLWALSMVFGEALCGARPSPGRTVGLDGQDSIERWLFQRALNRNRDRRPRSAAEWLAELRSVSAQPVS